MVILATGKFRDCVAKMIYVVAILVIWTMPSYLCRINFRMREIFAINARLQKTWKLPQRKNFYIQNMHLSVFVLTGLQQESQQSAKQNHNEAEQLRSKCRNCRIRVIGIIIHCRFIISHITIVWFTFHRLFHFQYFNWQKILIW